MKDNLTAKNLVLLMEISAKIEFALKKLETQESRILKLEFWLAGILTRIIKISNLINFSFAELQPFIILAAGK